jgi:hypothetical protein
MDMLGTMFSTAQLLYDVGYFKEAQEFASREKALGRGDSHTLESQRLRGCMSGMRNG